MFDADYGYAGWYHNKSAQRLATENARWIRMEEVREDDGGWVTADRSSKLEDAH